MASNKAIFQIHSVFYINGRGLTFAGDLLDGSIDLGDYIEFEANGRLYKRMINVRDSGGNSIDGKVHYGISIRTENEAESTQLTNWKPNKAIATIKKIKSEWRN